MDFLVAHMVKNPPTMQGDPGPDPCWENSLEEKAMQATPVFQMENPMEVMSLAS